MKKIFMLFILSISLYSHELKLFVEDNKNNTITVVGEFDTGDSTEGIMVKLESMASGDILYQQRLPKKGEIVVDIPKEPYKVVLDAGMEGHALTKQGIAPLEGFKEVAQNLNTKKQVQKESILAKWDFLTISFFSLCLVAFLLAIYFSNKNTKLILEKLKES